MNTATVRRLFRGGPSLLEYAMKQLITMTVVFSLFCGSNVSTASGTRIEAANTLTSQYAQSKFAQWELHAVAAGADCSVLYITTAKVLDDSVIEAMHYGAAPHDVYPGGVNRFYRDQHFLGAAYKDHNGRLWTYGEVTLNRSDRLDACP